MNCLSKCTKTTVLRISANDVIHSLCSQAIAKPAFERVPINIKLANLFASRSRSTLQQLTKAKTYQQWTYVDTVQLKHQNAGQAVKPNSVDTAPDVAFLARPSTWLPQICGQGLTQGRGTQGQWERQMVVCAPAHHIW